MKVLHDVQQITRCMGDQNRAKQNSTCMTQAVLPRNVLCINSTISLEAWDIFIFQSFTFGMPVLAWSLVSL